MHTYLMCWFIEVAERAAAADTTTAKKKKKSAKTVWDLGDKEKALSALIEVLELDLSKLWKIIEEDCVNLFNKVVGHMLENAANTKAKAVKQCIFALATMLVQQYDQSANMVPSFIHLLHRHDHTVAPLSDLVAQLGKDERSASIIGDVLRELSSDTGASARGSGPKNIAQFISDIAEANPRAILPHVSLLIGHLANDTHQVRNGVIQVLGFLVAKAFNDSDEEVNNSNMAKQRDAMLEVLEERFHDSSSYTRSKVIQTWNYLVEQRAVPKAMIPSLATAVVARLEDKAAQVRKSAIGLMTSMLQYNPYLGELKLSTFQLGLQEANAQLAALTHKNLEEQPGAEASESSQDTADSMNEEEQEMNDDGEDEAGAEAEEPSQPLSEDADERTEEQSVEEKKCITKCEYFRDAVAFIERIHEAMPTVTKLLSSSTIGDVQESIRFIVTAIEFKIEAVRSATPSLLALVWSKDAAIKAAVIEAYTQLYLRPQVEDMDERACAMMVANNLVSIVASSTQSELMSIAELVKELSSAKQISSLTEKCLWAIFADKIEGVPQEHACSALVVLCFIAEANPDMIFNHFQILLSQGFGERCKEDERFAKYACIALQKLVKRKSKDKLEPPMRFPMNHPMFEKMTTVLKEKSASTARWYPAAEQAINAIYLLAEHPDAICSDVIKSLYDSMRVSAEDDACSVERLSKLVFVLGQVALQQIIFLEDVQVELRRRRTVKEKLAEERGAVKGSKSTEAIEDELGLNMASEESESEYLQNVAEYEVVLKNLLGKFAPLIIAVCQNKDGNFTDSTLRNAASIALAKYMCVSARFCDDNLRLLFTLLERAPEPEIRSGIIISLGDLCARHHNLVAPWTGHIFSRLRDDNTQVRKNTLMVLSHLILNEVIKPKGQISEIALCMEDGDPEIADLAKLFFHELANKTNAVYNHLPDMLSHMSSSDEISSDAFRRLMKYMFSFITKERQTESLVEKLCSRFRVCTDIPGWTDVAFCLGLLNYSERCMKRLLDNLKSYQNLLVHDSVFEHMEGIAIKTKKFCRAEMKPQVEEYEEKIRAAHLGEDKENGAEEVQAESTVKKPARKARKTATRGKSTRRTKRV
eukprot:TRINITY_DN2231_c0_g1_i2.p1 TRINITY_DN2231_c0_g1~~TRINITY_DN2231_c0_g1_i2.p1  ORF type:complete len:1245 (+),score=332.82 TRINITY_DN2231_c0_g1_i2:437-3736(+)